MARRSIQGARAVVTGASSGIGWELALELARQGARLVVTARRQQRLEELARQIRPRQPEVHCVPGDLTDPQVRQQVLHEVQSQFGGLDILVNNAGLGAVGPFAHSDPQWLRQVMEVNFFAPVELIRLGLPLLQAGRRPIIVNVSSVLGHRAVPQKSEYCASKFALHGFSDSLRAELAPAGIDVLLVSPSTTESEFFDQALGGQQTELAWRKLGAMSASGVARKTVRAIRSGRHEIILTIGGKLLVWLDRFSPPVVNRLVARFA